MWTGASCDREADSSWGGAGHGRAGQGMRADGKGGASGNGANGAGDAAMSLEDKIKEIKDALNYMEKDEL